MIKFFMLIPFLKHLNLLSLRPSNVVSSLFVLHSSLNLTPSFSDAVRILYAPAIPTTIFRLGYPRLA